MMASKLVNGGKPASEASMPLTPCPNVSQSRWSVSVGWDVVVSLALATVANTAAKATSATTTNHP